MGSHFTWALKLERKRRTRSSLPSRSTLPDASPRRPAGAPAATAPPLDRHASTQPPPLPTAVAAALPRAGDLADPAEEDEDDGVAAAGRRRSGETGEPRSPKFRLLVRRAQIRGETGLSLTPSSS